MINFKDYALFYNLFYTNKAYDAESQFVFDVLFEYESFLSDSRLNPTVLDLGCGTGEHAFALSKHGVKVHGIDLSEHMIAMAKERLSSTPHLENTCFPVFQTGDARSLRLKCTFDAVISLFHVISYQTSEEDFLAVLETAGSHLMSGGLFLFDFWHGPGVLTDLPEKRERFVENDEVRVLRKACPELIVDKNIVDVNYEIIVSRKAENSQKLINETHRMRYWFIPELRYLAESSGFRVLEQSAWLERREPNLNDWYAWMLLCKL